MKPERAPFTIHKMTMSIDVLRALFGRGCGAMVEDHGCNLSVKPTLTVCNQSMSFLLWRNTMNPDGTCWCFLCGRHDGSMDRVMLDMTDAQRIRQMEEAKRWAARGHVPWCAPGVITIIDVTAVVREPAGSDAGTAGWQAFLVELEALSAVLPILQVRGNG